MSKPKKKKNSNKPRSRSRSSEARSPTPQHEPGSRGSVQISRAEFSGPIPPPALLDQYNQVLPGLAERLIVMAEQQSASRRAIEKRLVWASTRHEMLGLIFAFLFAVGTLTAGVWLVYTGHSAEGLAAVIAAIGTPAAIFVYERKRRR